MHAKIEIKYMSFSRLTKEFRLLYKIEEFEGSNWEEVIMFKLREFKNVKECFFALKNNLYYLYEQLDIEIPFESIEWKFQRNAKKMGIDLYE